jgi:hypothetical protein
MYLKVFSLFILGTGLESLVYNIFCMEIMLNILYFNVSSYIFTEFLDGFCVVRRQKIFLCILSCYEVV